MARKQMKFPSISRIIHDKNYLSILIGTLFILLSLIMVSFDFGRNLIINREELNKKRNLLVQEVFWQQNLSKYKDYRDGYLAFAQIEYELGNSSKSLDLVKKALEIDPNYKDAIVFEKFLTKN